MENNNRGTLINASGGNELKVREDSIDTNSISIGNYILKEQGRTEIKSNIRDISIGIIRLLEDHKTLLIKKATES